MNREIREILINDYGWDFESDFFTDEINTMVEEVISATLTVAYNHL